MLLTACSALPNENKNTESTEIIHNSKEEEIKIICQTVKAMDFTIKQPYISISQEEDVFYKEAYLSVLKSEIPTTNNDGKIEYFRELYKIGVEFAELDNSYSYYYDDLDEDGLPELAIKSTGYTYILKYILEQNEFMVLFSGPTMYYTILGAKQLSYHDGLHAGLIRDRYIILNDNYEWEIVLDLEKGIDTPLFYAVGTDEFYKIDIGEKNWNEITPPFFEAVDQAIPSKTFKEIFGELL